MRTRVVLPALALVLFTAACTSTPPPAPEPSVPVLMPGKPGEQATFAPPGQAPVHRETPNDADVTYVTMMIPHHQQAIVMTDLVRAKATSEQVRAIAGRIAVAQEGEITLMKTWLADYGQQHAGHAHDHGLMPGMATPAQLDELRAATGPDFDRKFLDLMMAHHTGALTMAEAQLSGGVEIRAQELAQEVITGQSAEIERMRTLRATL